MAGEAVEAWIDSVLKSSAIMEAYIDRRELDDSFGWGALLDAMWFSESGRRLTGSGVLLTGPEGSGRHTAAYHMIKGLLGREYAHAFLTDLDFDADPGGAQAAKERLWGLLDRFYDRKQALCIVLEQTETGRNVQSVLRSLGETLCEYWLCEDYPPLFVILIASERTPIPAPLRERLRLCRMSLPNETRRKIFLENRAGDLRRYAPFDTLLSQTEGMSYAELLDVADNVRALVDQADGAVSREELSALLETQRPARDPEVARVRVLGRLEALIDGLPSLLTELASEINTGSQKAGPIPHPIPNSPPEPRPEDLAGERARIERLPVSVLAEELFGRERAAQLLRQDMSNPQK